MNYKFEIIDGRKHLILEEYPLFNTFLQSEGASFEDLIADAISKFKTNKTAYFAGNIFSIDISEDTTLLADEIFDKENIIPTPLFIEIFEEWQKN